MEDAKCDFQYLGPIIDTVATTNTRTREFHLKTFKGDLDPEIQGILNERGSQEASILKQLESAVNRAKKNNYHYDLETSSPKKHVRQRGEDEQKARKEGED